MDTGLNFEAIKAQLEEAEWEKCEEPDREVRRIFLGTVFALTPSGKYYMPWACSNVTEAEADEDVQWREAVEAELAKFDAYLTSGEGDPCDLFAEQIRDKEENSG
jgi:hypothetical protein